MRVRRVSKSRRACRRARLPNQPACWSNIEAAEMRVSAASMFQPNPKPHLSRKVGLGANCSGLGHEVGFSRREIDRHRVMLMLDQPLAVDLAITIGRAQHELHLGSVGVHPAEILNTVSEREVAA